MRISPDEIDYLLEKIGLMETVNKTLDILELFLKQEGEVGLAELANTSGLNISTVYRIVSTLVKRGYLKQRQKRGKYSLGLKLLEFNNAIKNTLKIGDLAQPHLQKLSKLCGEYVEIAVLDSYEAITIAQAEVDRNLRISNIIGERLPLHATSLGKVFLAYMKEGDRTLFYSKRKLRPYTSNTITDISRLERETETIRQQGYAIDNGELDVGVWSVGAPVYDSSKNIQACLAIASPSARMNGARVEELISLIKSSSYEISREMGYKDDGIRP